MKNLKFAFVLLFSSLVVLTSCDENNVSPFDLDAEESAILDLVFLATGEGSPSDSSQKRGHKGKCNMTDVAIADLPVAITNYITASYEGGTTVRAGTNNEDGSYGVLVELADGRKVGVKFDADGAFVAERTKKQRGESVAVEDLDAVITDYITANYADATILGARSFDDEKTGVAIQQADESKLGLAFDTGGAFLGEMSLKKKR